METLKNTSNQNSLEQLSFALQEVMRQHHIGIIGFGIFLVGHILFIFQIINKKTISNLDKASRQQGIYAKAAKVLKQAKCY